VKRSFVNVRLTRNKKEVGQIDAAILVDHDAVCIIEAKAVFIRDDTLSDNDAYIQAIGKKYGASARAGDRRQGVVQLARIAESIAGGGLAPEFPDEIRNARVVYPVSLVHDRNVDAPGIGEYLASEFQRELKMNQSINGYVQLGQVRIALPILLAVDDFEWLEASLENFSLVEFLRDFAESVPTRGSSVRDFAAQSSFKARMRNPVQQWGVAQDLFLKLSNQVEPATGGNPHHEESCDDGHR
jgi:hypothetical protein